MKSGIYMIKNAVNGKHYIGSAVNLGSRLANHRSTLRRGRHDNGHLQNAWNKYGEANFEFSIVEEVPDEKMLVEREQWHIDATAAVLKGYNIMPNAGSNLGFKHTEEWKEKLSERMRGNTYSKGIKHSPIALTNMKDSKAKFIGVPKSEEVKNKISAAQVGRRFSNETRGKMSEAQRRRAALYTFNGQHKSLRSWAEELHINLSTLQGRLRRGWNLEKALSTPVNHCSSSS